VLRAVGIYFRRSKQQIELICQYLLYGVYTAGARNLKGTFEASLQADIRDDFLRATMFMEHLGTPFGSQIPHLLGLTPEINHSRLESYRKIDRITFQIGDGKKH